MSYKLRSYFRSSCSWRVRISLAYKGLSYETIPVHLLKDGGQQHGEPHRHANPMRELPVLMVGDEPLAQSMAILEYLEEVHPSPSLLPQDHLGRARVRQMAEVINSGIQPIQNLRVMQKLQKDFSLEKADAMKWSADWIRFGFDALEVLVAKHSGKYCFGNEPSIADACLIPQLFNARRFSVDLEVYPNLTRVESALNAIEAFQASHPSQQPDAE
jgi:maleylpyruvate isomerase